MENGVLINVDSEFDLANIQVWGQLRRPGAGGRRPASLHGDVDCGPGLGGAHATGRLPGVALPAFWQWALCTGWLRLLLRREGRGSLPAARSFVASISAALLGCSQMGGMPHAWWQPWAAFTPAVQAAAAKVGKKARVLIRINPDVDPQVRPRPTHRVAPRAPASPLLFARAAHGRSVPWTADPLCVPR